MRCNIAGNIRAMRSRVEANGKVLSKMKSISHIHNNLCSAVIGRCEKQLPTFVFVFSCRSVEKNTHEDSVVGESMAKH